MTHEQIAGAFLRGDAAKNKRLITDGSSIIDHSTCYATKLDTDVIVVWFGQGRSGSIARSAIRRAVVLSGKPWLLLSTSIRPRTPAELRAQAESDRQWREALGLEPPASMSRGDVEPLPEVATALFQPDE